MSSNPPVIRILKREKNAESRDAHPTNELVTETQQSEPSVPDKEAIYETTRAQILGPDFSETEAEGSSVNLQASKARYRGQDMSEYDPDYVRLPATPFFPVTSMQPSSDMHEQYPSLGQAYQARSSKP